MVWMLIYDYIYWRLGDANNICNHTLTMCTFTDKIDLQCQPGPSKPWENCALNTIHYGGNIHHFFYIFGYLIFFTNIWKIKLAF